MLADYLIYLLFSLASFCPICLNVEIMELVTDLHLHSRFSRAVSQKMNLVNMYIYGKKKGINLLSVADFTHPIWFKEIKSQLEEVGSGIYKIKDKEKIDQENNFANKPYLGPYFFLSTEIACIYSENGKVHKIHNLIMSPDLSVAEKINKTLSSQGFNLTADGRPILGATSRNLYDLLLSVDKDIIIIPCHVWTPWFSLYGSKSGYDSVDDCFGDYSKYIYAIETGLSSDPNMNWRIKELKDRSIVSSSDAHSLEKMAREATVFKTRLPGKFSDLSYKDMVAAFKKDKNGRLEIAYTIEFYPEEGKYHYTGHRLCGISYSPEDVKIKGKICPVCKRELTVGVMDRVEELAGGPDTSLFEKDENGVVWVKDKQGIRPSYVSIVPLLEVIREAIGVNSISDKVTIIYDKLIDSLAPEFELLLKTPLSEIEKVAGREVAIAVKKVRERDLKIEPGFDGEFGKVDIDVKIEEAKKIKDETRDQMGFGF